MVLASSVPAEQDGQCHRGGGRAAAGPSQRHHGRARRDFADDSGERESALVRRRRQVLSEKDLHFNVFVHQKWTPYLMMLTLFNSISGVNEFADEATYRLNGKVELNGHAEASPSPRCWPPGEMPVPRPCCWPAGGATSSTACSSNAVKTPQLKSVNATIDLLPERRVAAIENAWVANNEVRGRRRSAGEGLPAALSRRAHRARIQGEDSRRPGRRASTASCSATPIH